MLTRTGLMLSLPLLLLAADHRLQAEPRERRIEVHSVFGIPAYSRDTVTVPLTLTLDEHAKRFVGVSAVVTEVHPIRPNENVPVIIHPYEPPLKGGKLSKTEITFHVKRDAKYRIELQLVFEDEQDQLLHRMEKEEIHGERK